MCISWTAIVRRFDGSGDYNRSWDEYKHGFGDASGEYWLGNEYLHYLTSSRAYKLRFDMEDWDGNTAYAEYSTFRVTSEADNYRLLLGGYSGTASANQAADASLGFLYQNNTQFSTYDRDNDGNPLESCINRLWFGSLGGFWYNDCAKVYVTNNVCQCGVGTCSCVSNGNIWVSWLGTDQSLKKVQMMFRPI